MIFHQACSVRAAIAWAATLSIDARFLCGTFAVFAATWWRFKHNATTFTIFVGHKEFGTFANHRSYWRTVQHTAASGCGAWRQLFARFHAFLANTGQTARTIVVVFALGTNVQRDTFTIR